MLLFCHSLIQVSRHVHVSKFSCLLGIPFHSPPVDIVSKSPRSVGAQTCSFENSMWQCQEPKKKKKKNQTHTCRRIRFKIFPEASLRGAGPSCLRRKTRIPPILSFYPYATAEHQYRMSKSPNCSAHFSRVNNAPSVYFCAPLLVLVAGLCYHVTASARGTAATDCTPADTWSKRKLPLLHMEMRPGNDGRWCRRVEVVRMCVYAKLCSRGCGCGCGCVF